MPKRGLHYPGSYAELRAWFPDDEACMDYLDWLRWPMQRESRAAHVTAKAMSVRVTTSSLPGRWRRGLEGSAWSRSASNTLELPDQVAQGLRHRTPGTRPSPGRVQPRLPTHGASRPQYPWRRNSGRGMTVRSLQESRASSMVQDGRSTSNAGCLPAIARICSSVESGPTPSKKMPTSTFHRFK